MSLIPDEELKGCASLHLSPMIDFLFLVVAVFATLAVTKAALYDRDIKLVQVRSAQAEHEPIPLLHDTFYIVNLSIDSQGQYKWLTEFNEYLIESTQGIQSELRKQQDLGLLPQDKGKTKVLLHIDKCAQWEPIAQVIFAVRQLGFEIHPVYDNI